MKKIISLALTLTLALLCCACAPKAAPEKTLWDVSDMPRIDGSTATIPLSEALACDLLGYTPEEAQSYIHHNTTHYAYENLINGECDVIFVTPPSEEEYKMIEESGEEYEIIRVVKDAFVFLVNAQNKIESISSDDVRAVYRGEKKNWNEIGGEDMPIIAYQRPDNSGSQTLMYKLCVPADKITPAPKSLKPGGMGDLIDAVSSFDGGKGALGYSVYYYASGMYVRDGARLCAIDGVMPTNESIKDDSYPFVDGYYAVFRKSEAEGSPVRNLISYLLSPDGQKTAEAAGYVPVA
ncbi:MAG: substrate-binding domain-containing protein [Clostridia bacterium]|nr:substrate-binding domain-containing protein [Clostridia bacterium]